MSAPKFYVVALAASHRGSVYSYLVSLLCAATLVVALFGTTSAVAQVAPTPQSDAEPVTATEAAGIPEESWAVHGQATNVTQYQPAFHSAYQGPQSLSPAANSRETADATMYLGVRPWAGAELWFNPEIDQGFGLGDTFGLAGYASGEAYKAGARDPYFLTQRLFLRQTINLGGSMQKLDPDINQLGGLRTANRLVITAGKFSVVDIFDTNKYAHDPRGDFLNWSILDAGSFDYAANSWGYSYGAAVEWYQDWWAVRAGLFDLSTTPNGKNMYPRVFGQDQFLTELEERHTIWSQPGKLKVLYWLIRGDLGSYNDAVALAAATGQLPSTANVRTYRTKAGAALNLEQQLAADLGLFLRAGFTQGGVEEVDFTEIDQSVSGGLSLTGTGWGRPDDTIGLGFAVNQISHAAKQFFADGGLGGLIGDGQLANAGPEQIGEAYYSLAVLAFAHLTADYQFINHPAYNRDRGPVSIFGLRLHAEF